MQRLRLTEISCSDPAGTPVIGPRVTEQRLRRSVFRILRANVLCSIASVTADNRAHINTAYFCYSDALELYFFSHPGALHGRNLSQNPSLAITVFSSGQEWGGSDAGVQLFGNSDQAKGSLAKLANRLYGQRFPAFVKWRASWKKGDVAQAYRFYRFLTEMVKVLDEREFGAGVFVAAHVRREQAAR